jgi:hypothetical protein
MPLPQLSWANTGVPVTEVTVGGGPVGASAAAAGDPGGGADEVRTGVPDCTAMGAEATGVVLLDVVLFEVPLFDVGSGAGSDGVEVETGIITMNCVCSDIGIPLVRLAVTS